MMPSPAFSLPKRLRGVRMLADKCALMAKWWHTCCRLLLVQFVQQDSEADEVTCL